MTKEQKMTQEQALGVLVQGVKIGQSKGAYTLEDAALLAQAIAVFMPKQENTQAIGCEKDVNELADESSGNEVTNK